MTEDTRAGRAESPSRVHQLGRLDRPGLLGRYMQLVVITSGDIAAAITRWDRDQLINKIIELEERRAEQPSRREEYL